MGTYEDLKAAIQQVIRTNGNNEITGALLQQTLLSIVNSVGANAAFAGIATPNTNPGTADQNIFYLATEPGTYVNFGGIEIAADEAVILTNKNGVWQKIISGFSTQENFDKLGVNISQKYRIQNWANLSLLRGGEIIIGPNIDIDSDRIQYSRSTIETGCINGFGNRRRLKAIRYVSSVGEFIISYATIENGSINIRQIATFNETESGIVKEVQVVADLPDNSAVVFSGNFAYATNEFAGQVLIVNRGSYIVDVQKNAMLFQEVYEADDIQDIPHPFFIENAPYITEIYITEAGRNADLKTAHIVYNRENNQTISFSNTGMDTYVAKGYAIPNSNILELRSYTNPLSETILGYVLIDFSQLTLEQQTLLEPLKDVVYNLDFSPSIKSYLIDLDTQEKFKTKLSITDDSIIKYEFGDNIINRCILENKYTLGQYIGIDGALDDTPAQFADIFAASDYIEVKPGDKLKGKLVYFDNIPQPATGAFFDSEQQFLVSFYSLGVRGGEYIIEVPENAAYMRLTLFVNVMLNYMYVNPFGIIKNAAKGKKINFLGDSITVGAYTDNQVQRYTNVLESLTGIIANNYGSSGTKIGGTESGAFWKRVLNIDLTADCLLVFGGTNDYWSDIPIGVKTSNNTDETCGAVNYIIEYWETNNPGKPIVFVLPFNQRWRGENCETNNGYGTLRDYCTAIKDVCERHGVPTLDLYTESGMDIALNDTHNSYYSVDGVHPNYRGHYVIAKKISDFLNELFK